MGIERIIKRYSAYYAGWCVAFGEHEISFDENAEIQWVFGESKVGITLSPRMKKQFVRELLGKHEEMPEIVLTEEAALINRLECPIAEGRDREVYARFREFFRCREEVHMFLTSHFCYPTGTRILTFSKKKPVLIIYKEIEPLRLRVP